MSADVTATLLCALCGELTTHVLVAHRTYVCHNDGGIDAAPICGNHRFPPAPGDDAYGVGPLSEAWAGRDEADAAALRGGAA